MLSELRQKNFDLHGVVKKAAKDKDLVAQLLKGMLAKKCPLRFNCFKVLMVLADKHPEMLFSHWDALVKRLNSKNTYWQYQAIYLIAALSQSDKEGRFEKIFDQYCL